MLNSQSQPQLQPKLTQILEGQEDIPGLSPRDNPYDSDSDSEDEESIDE